MTATIANIAKGRINELVNRVNDSDPTNAVFVLALYKGTPNSTLDQLRDLDSFTAIEAVEDECDFTNYARITLDQDDVAAPTVDDSGNQQTFDIADQSIASAGGTSDNDIGLVVIGYDSDSTSGDDDDIIPVFFDLLSANVSTNGETLHIRVNASGLWSAGEAS